MKKQKTLPKKTAIQKHKDFIEELKQEQLVFDIKSIYNHKYICLLTDKEHRFIVIKGGRGSGKSESTADTIVISCLTLEGFNALVVRKVARTCRSSVFNQIKRSIDKFGLGKYFKVNKQLMTYTCLINDNQIVCEGLDDKEKLKGFIGINGNGASLVWLEEANQCSEEDLDTLDLTIRGDFKHNARIIITFNPTTKNSWLYRRFWKVKREDSLVFTTSYKDNRFLNSDFIKRMKNLKIENLEKYKILGLGHWGMITGAIYKNWKVERLSKEDKDYEMIFYGLDYGFSDDPHAVIKVGIKNKEIYVLDEVTIKNGSLDDLFTLMKDKMKIPLNAVISADHLPINTSYLRKKGYINIRNANKTQKIETVNKLADYKMHINECCSEFINEVSNYKYKEDKSGKSLAILPDGDDHLLDAFIYSLKPWLLTQLRDKESNEKVRISLFDLD